MHLPFQLLQQLKDFPLQPYPSFTGLPQPITLQSLSHFFGALLWAWLLLVNFTGWGRLAEKLARVQRLPISVACSMGIAVTIFLGGWLNLLHAIYPTVLFTYVVIGVLLYVLLRKQSPEASRWSNFWNNSSHWSRLLIVVTLLIMVFRVAGTVRLGTFRGDDDGMAYMVFPQKMLAAHHFASDPFSDRRVISSLGGSYLLQAFVIAATSLPHIGMADRTLGLVLLFLALLDLGIAFGLPPPQIAILELLAYLAPQETFNLTFNILPIPLVLAIVWIILATAGQQEQNRWRYAACLGGIGGAIIALKSTFLPYVGAVALLPYLTQFWRLRRKDAWSLPIIAGLFSLVVIAAWMVAMQHDSGTFLFPVLGHGVDYSSYSIFPSMPRFASDRALAKIFPQGIALLTLAAVQAISGIRDSRSRLSFSVLIAAALAITAFNYESGGDYIWRYNFPQFFTAILVFAAAQAALYMSSPADRRTRSIYGIALLSLAGCMFYYDFEGGHFGPFRQMRTEICLYRGNLWTSLSGMALVSPADFAEYRAVETALPPSSVALVNSTDAFLLTGTGRRKILVDDWAGAASPRPGWPFTQNPRAVAAFLRKNSVRYLVFNYDYANWIDMRACGAIPNRAHFSELDHALEILNTVTHRQFNQIRTMYKPIYDDGKIAVIDLAAPVPAGPPVGPAWTLHTSEVEMCSKIVPRYVATHSPNTAKPNGCE